MQADNAPKRLTGGDGSGIIQTSELGTFKQRLLSDSRIDDDYYSVIKERYSHGSDNAKAAFNKFIPNDSVEDAIYSGVPCYDPNTNKIYMSYSGDLYNPRGPGVTWFHEHGHMLDNALGSISHNEEYINELQADFMKYVKDYERKIT